MLESGARMADLTLGFALVYRRLSQITEPAHKWQLEIKQQKKHRTFPPF